MEANPKVVAAIGTAVTAYIQEEKAAKQAARVRAAQQTANAWGQSGRQEIMRNRQMWQLRIVPG
jgi:hypothetical protein